MKPLSELSTPKNPDVVGTHITRTGNLYIPQSITCAVDVMVSESEDYICFKLTPTQGPYRPYYYFGIKIVAPWAATWDKQCKVFNLQKQDDGSWYGCCDKKEAA